ncbi:GNAT family N-acetyltransferase [Streptomyces sp. NPDC092046]|uniref:GNAT family N-acetyltransferase n=1 Tax=Streptomyces sp. NPDC092046 TaxID=3366009 RepID=UPI00380CE9B5
MAGVAGFQLGGRGLTGGGARDVPTAYGTVRGLPRPALPALLERRPAAHELVMDGIAVDAGRRGLGVGGLLLREIADVAAEHGCRRVRLDVIDVTPRARALHRGLLSA